MKRFPTPGGSSAAVIGAILLASVCAAENVVRNGSFEMLRADKNPQNWSFEVWRQAPVTLEVVPEGFSGKNALRITNSMEKKKPHVFGSCNQRIRLAPDTDYIFSFKGKGDPGSEIIMICGKSWTTRKTFAFTGRWQQFGARFRLSPKELEKDGSTYLRLNSDKFCGNVLIDDVQVVPKGDVILDNGDLEGLPGDVPWGWRFFCSRNAQCTAALNRDGQLLIQNRTPARPHVFGGLEQWIRLTPGQPYDVKIRYKCDSEANQLALGLKWQTRLKLPASPEWKEMVFRITAPLETRPDGTIPFLFLCDDVSQETLLDSISIEPVGKTEFPAADWQDQRLYGVPRFEGDFDKLQSIPRGLPVLSLPRSAQEVASGRMPDSRSLSARVAMGADPRGLLFFAEVKDDLCVTVPGEEMWRGDSVQLRIDCGAYGAASEMPTDLEVTFSVGQDGKPYAWCNVAGRDNSRLAGKALPSTLCRLTGRREGGSYFIAARLDWSLLKPVDPKTQPWFGFTAVVNDSDRTGEREIAFLTPGLHDAKYSNCYFNAMLPTSRPEFRLLPGKDASPDFLGGELLAAGLQGSCRFSAEWRDSSGKIHQGEIGTVEVTSAENLLKLPFQLRLPAGFEGRYHLTLRMNGRKVLEQEGSKLSPEREAAENINRLLARLDRTNRAIDALERKGKRSHYLSVPRKILNLHLPEIAGRFNAAKREGERNYYARQINMITPECQELFSEMEANIRKLENGGTLPQTWSYRSSPIRLVDGWPTAVAENESGRRETRPIVCAGYGHFEHIDRDITFLRELGVNTVTVEIGPRMVFPKEGRSHEFEPDFTYFDNRYNSLLQKAWENDIQVCLLVSPHYCPKWLLDKYPDMKIPERPNRKPGFIRYEITHPKAQEMIRRYLNALIPHLKKNPYVKAIHSICMSNEPEYLYSWPDNPVTVRNFTAWMEKKFGSIARFNAETGKNYPDFAAVVAAESKETAASYIFRDFVRETYAAWHRNFADEVRRLWPGVKVHSKIMISFSPYTYVSGVDPELWAEFSDLNGNDNICMQGGRYASDMAGVILGDEIQISSKKVSVVNSENHIIVDGETKPISNDHIYASVFEQFATGAATVLTWVYHDVLYDFSVKYPKEARLGCIYMRPGNLAAHARAVLDGMRLAPELKRFMQYEPDVAFLYSPTSAMLHSRNGCLYPMSNLALQLASTGYRARALTERQLAAKKFGATRLLFVAGAPNITRASLAGLKKFAQEGGRIIADPLSLKQDEYGRPLALDFPVERVKDFTSENTAQLIASTPAVLKLPFGVSAGEKGMDGILFRAVPDGNGSWLVNLMNYNHDRRMIALRGNGTWHDLLEEEPASTGFPLESRKIRMLRFTPKK